MKDFQLHCKQLSLLLEVRSTVPKHYLRAQYKDVYEQIIIDYITRLDLKYKNRKVVLLKEYKGHITNIYRSFSGKHVTIRVQLGTGSMFCKVGDIKLIEGQQ